MRCCRRRISPSVLFVHAQRYLQNVRIQATVNALGGQKLFAILPPANSCLVPLNLVPPTVSYLVSKTDRT